MLGVQPPAGTWVAQLEKLRWPPQKWGAQWDALSDALRRERIPHGSAVYLAGGRLSPRNCSILLVAVARNGWAAQACLELGLATAKRISPEAAVDLFPDPAASHRLKVDWRGVKMKGMKF